jgi:tetratricopeptide (TPR) repeat protein
MHFNQGDLQPEKIKIGIEESSCSDASHSKPFSCIVFKVLPISVPEKYNGNVNVFRYLIKDYNYGFMIASYSMENDARSREDFVRKVFIELKKTGYRVEKILTDKTCLFGKLINIEHQICSYGELKKHFIFSKKKNNYIKDRQKYETCGDFIFDSLSTAGKINDRILSDNSIAGKKIIKVLKSINLNLHNDSMCMCENKLCDRSVLKVLSRKFDEACSYQKAFDIENSLQILNQIGYILKGSNIHPGLYFNVLFKKAAAYGMKGKNSEAKHLVTYSLNLLSNTKTENKNEIRRNFYTLLADIYRYEMNKNRALHYMKTALEYARKTYDNKAVAMNHIYLGAAYLYFEMPDQAATQFNLSQRKAEEFGLNEVLDALKGYRAAMYKYTGKYTEAISYFKKKIIDHSAGATTSQKAFLFGKYADLMLYTGELVESLDYFNRAIDLIKKYPEIVFFKRIHLLTSTKKALVLIKLNDYREALNLCEENLIMARKLGDKNILTTNLSYIQIMHAASGNVSESEKHLNDIMVLLKNNHKPDLEYKYLLGKGLIHKALGEFKKAEEYLIRAVNTAEKISRGGIEYFASAISLSDLYCMMQKSDEAHKHADEIIYRASAANLHSQSFKAEMLKIKSDYFLCADHKGYLKYLKGLDKTGLNDEIKYYIESQILSVSRIDSRASDLFL